MNLITMNLTYEHENYEIKINKMCDSVYIEFYDNKLYKTFSNTFLDTDIVTITGKSIDTFYTVMNTVFNALIDKDSDKSTLNIIYFNKQIKLDIHHKYYIDIKFELELNLNNENSLNDKNICLKKLEDKIKSLEIKNNELTKYIDDLREFINTNMDVSIDVNGCIRIPFNSINITIDNYYNNKIYDVINENITISNGIMTRGESIKINSPINFNKNFCNINCCILTLISDEIFVRFSSENTINSNRSGKGRWGSGKGRWGSGHMGHERYLPLNKLEDQHLPYSVETLNIYQYTKMYKFELPKLINLNLCTCTIEFIYDKIQHLKTLKNITINNCNNFKERELLISKGYNVKILA